MYCVIQEVKLKKPNRFGEYKELLVTSSIVNGLVKYSYEYSGGRFERPENKAYKISIHESKRINGVVTKKQYAVTTVNYYDLAVDMFFLDINFNRLITIAEKLNTNVESLRNLVIRKLRPIQQQIMDDYQKTDEYKTRVKFKKIITKYHKNKMKFSIEYKIDNYFYDYCYDVHGKLMNKDYLDKLLNERDEENSWNKKTKRSTEKKREYKDFSEASYDDKNENVNTGNEYKYFKFNYNNAKIGNSHTSEETMFLKQFYHVLAKNFHPDVNMSKDATKQMQFLNKLKDEWGI